MAPLAPLENVSAPVLRQVRTEDERLMERAIRDKVFIGEQNVDPSIEYEHEEESVHFLLFASGRAVGCGRYRTVGTDLKLERIAVLKEQRGKGSKSKGKLTATYRADPPTHTTRKPT